jgi:circadian clock protein KaiB
VCAAPAGARRTGIILEQRAPAAAARAAARATASAALRPSPRDPKEAALTNYLLKLYVTGKTPRSEMAIANLRRICNDELRGQYEMQIIDVLEHPQLAEDERILATPTLIKRLPPPLRRVIGDLSDTEKVLLGLDVWPDAPTPTQSDAP